MVCTVHVERLVRLKKNVREAMSLCFALYTIPTESKQGQYRTVRVWYYGRVVSLQRNGPESPVLLIIKSSRSYEPTRGGACIIREGNTRASSLRNIRAW